MQRTNTSNQRRVRWQHWLIVAAAVIVTGIVVAAVAIAHRGPFSRHSIAEALQETVPGQITIGSLRTTYFPSLGCVAENVQIIGGTQGQPLVITARKLSINSGFSAIFTNHIDRVRAEGLVIRVPSGVGLTSGSGHQRTPNEHVISRFIADGAVVEFDRDGTGEPPLRFDLPKLTLRESGLHAPISFQADILNPEPAGEIAAEGRFGPWHPADPGQTAVEGSYVFNHADLSVFDGIAGILSSKGQFNGTLGHIDINGSTETPNFEVTHSHHRVDLHTRFHAIVNGINGDTVLEPADVEIDQTSIHSQASVEGKNAQEGKLTTLDTKGQGRIQDLLRMCVNESPPAMNGAITLKAHLTLPSGDRPFLKRLRVQGDFTVDEVAFSKKQTQDNLDTLSTRAQGKKVKKNEDPPPVRGNLTGHVDFKDGIATFSGLSFTAPGLLAHLSGNFDLIRQKVNLRGTLATKAELSHSTSGIKALILKPLDPIFKRKSAGAVVSVYIKGTYDHPFFGVDLDDGPR